MFLTITHEFDGPYDNNIIGILFQSNYAIFTKLLEMWLITLNKEFILYERVDLNLMLWKILVKPMFCKFGFLMFSFNLKKPFFFLYYLNKKLSIRKNQIWPI